MARSIALGLYLMLAGRGAAAVAVRPERPEGSLVWINAGDGSREESVCQLFRLIQARAPKVNVLVTMRPGTDLSPDPQAARVVRDEAPSEALADIRGFLDHWRPDAALFVGTSLPPALIAEAGARGVPMTLADFTLDGRVIAPWRRGMTASVLGRFRRILAQDPETVAMLTRIGGRRLPVELGGRIEETKDALPCVEAEREAMAELLAGRPVWLAVACPEVEEEMVIAAHLNALQHAHRLLLILSPADAVRADALAERLAGAELIAAFRGDEGYPESDVQVFVTEGAQELGLWYRLAPMTYMGGTLTKGATGRDPTEPAALGSAIVHGPGTGGHVATYGRLVDARATRPVASAEGLAAAVADLIAPDKAAILAHNAWAATSGGADVAERVVRATLMTLAGTGETAT